MRVAQRLRNNWPEYLIEAGALGCFMVSAGVFSVLIDHPQGPMRGLVESDLLRRALVGLAMGVTSIAIVYSPWGRRSGAHMNPAMTFAFWYLGKIATVDAVCYAVAQFAGGAAGVFAAYAILGAAFADPPVHFVATVPGTHGSAIAFMAELVISFLLLYAVLSVIARPRFALFSGIAAGALVLTFITVEAPLSGMSMNPARSFASALPAQLWSDLWLYFTAPVLGMGLAAALHARSPRSAGHCAKFIHTPDQRCIHCGYDPVRALGAQRKTWGEIAP
jgi:aquaporin Z